MDKEQEQIIDEKLDDENAWETHYLDKHDEEWEAHKTQKRKRKSVIVKIVSTIIVFSLIITGLQLWFNLFNLPALHFKKESNILSENPEVNEYKQSVVLITWGGVKGTGFNTAKNGLIATNAHVVKNTNNVEVFFNNGEKFYGKVIARNEDLDLAVVDIEANNLPFLPISYEKNWEKWNGDHIIFIGNPLSHAQIVNEGTVGGKVNIMDWNIPVMKIEAPVYKGNSGSPVINQNGEVIGVIFATIPSNDDKQVGVAVPSYYLREVLQ